MAFTPLNALNAFLAVARRRSFAGAAKDLGISTSAVSQSVRQLETRLGVALLARTSRSVSRGTIAPSTKACRSTRSDRSYLITEVRPDVVVGALNRMIDDATGGRENLLRARR